MKNFLIALILVGVLGGGYWWWQNKEVMPETTENETMDTPQIPEGAVMEDGTIPEEETESSGQGTSVKVITMAEVASHNNDDSCWSVIDGNVYDLTNWIGQHPGGREAILKLCGADGTVLFHGQHKDNKQQADALANFKIGALAR